MGREGGRSLEGRVRGVHPRHPDRVGDTCEHSVVGGERPGVTRGGPRAALSGAPFEHHHRLRRRRLAQGVHQRWAVGDPLEVGEPDGGLLVSSEEGEVIAHADVGGVAGGDSPGDTDTGRAGQVQEG